MPTLDPNLPPRPGEGEAGATHARAIIRAAIAVAVANQTRHEVANVAPLDMDMLVAASAQLELAITELTEACVEAQIASSARWS